MKIVRRLDYSLLACALSTKNLGKDSNSRTERGMDSGNVGTCLDDLQLEREIHLELG